LKQKKEKELKIERELVLNQSINSDEADKNENDSEIKE
jgi:hypothetical protein